MVPSRLVGRNEALAHLRPVLLSPDCRLLTLTGAPGVGKSRLAAGLTATVSDRFPDGVHQVDLVGCSAVADVTWLLASGLATGRVTRSTAADRLMASLADRQVLIVLDSCEAVPGLAALLRPLLASAQMVKVLATSQERLPLATQHEYAVPPLRVPAEAPVREADLAALAEVPAVAMLLDCTRRAGRDIVLDLDVGAALVSICRHLQGLPLALEVAAARLVQFDAGELAVRLEHRDRLLDAPLASSGRHRRLRTAIAWSHDLLTADQRRVFRSVSVFPGPWTLAAAEEVLGLPDIDVVTGVATLVAKNLVRAADGRVGEETFELLDCLRRFGREQLSRHAEQEAVDERFRDYFVHLARRAEAAIGTADESVALHWSGHEFLNLRAALDRSRAASDLAGAQPLAAALGWHWYTHGGASEGRIVGEVVRSALAEPAGPDTGGLALVAGILAWARGELADAAALLGEARALAERDGVLRRAAVADAFLGHVARTSGHPERARDLHRSAETIFTALGNTRGVAWARHDLALVDLAQGRFDEAERSLRQALPVFQAEGDAWTCAAATSGLGAVAVRRREWDPAGRLLAGAAEGYAVSGDLPRLDHCRRLLAEVADARGLTALARELRTPGRPLAAALAQVRASATGKAVRDSPLTPRQRQVAALVARGETNRRIARHLRISDKTVEVHLSQIMTRLEVHNRAQVALHAAEAGLLGDVPPGTD